MMVIKCWVPLEISTYTGKIAIDFTYKVDLYCQKFLTLEMCAETQGNLGQVVKSFQATVFSPIKLDNRLIWNVWYIAPNNAIKQE